MPRLRRYIQSKTLYELTFRAKDSLPFPCTKVMEAIIYSILSRVQRDNKVIIHHFIVEVSHVHFLITANDANQCQQFYGEVKKQLTEAIKRLVGQKSLNLWEVRSNLSQIPTLEDAINKIVYIYSNPSKDDLENSIDEYPGVSSWNSFKNTAYEVNACNESTHEWIRQTMIPCLPSRSLNPRADKRLLRQILSQTNDKHKLKIYPNSWLNCFLNNASSEEIEHYNTRIIKHLRELENKYKRIRRLNQKGVKGAAALRNLPLLKPHTPKRKERKICVQSQFKEVRIAIIAKVKEIEVQCRKIYKQWATGDFSIKWPPGTFPPPLPPLASAL